MEPVAGVRFRTCCGMHFFTRLCRFQYIGGGTRSMPSGIRMSPVMKFQAVRRVGTRGADVESPERRTQKPCTSAPEASLYPGTRSWSEPHPVGLMPWP